jgi:hypothetical protein
MPGHSPSSSSINIGLTPLEASDMKDEATACLELGGNAVRCGHHISGVLSSTLERSRARPDFAGGLEQMMIRFALSKDFGRNYC